MPRTRAKKASSSPSPSPAITQTKLPLSPLAAYVRVWAVATICRVVSRAGSELLYNQTVAGCAFVALCFPLQVLRARACACCVVPVMVSILLCLDYLALWQCNARLLHKQQIVARVTLFL